MSFYATIAGVIEYRDQADFETAFGILKDGGWLDEADYLVDEGGERVTEHEPNVDRTNRTIKLPVAHYRNLARLLQDLFRGGTGKVVWTSTDGCFEGGVFVDGAETAYDLEVWNAAEEGEAAPNFDESAEEYFEWQAEVERAFFDEFRTESV